MRIFSYFLFIALSATLLVSVASCADTDQYVAEPFAHDPEPMPSYEQVLSEWETKLSSLGFADPSEAVPTDTLDPDYDNFIENQGFKSNRVVTITWDGNQVTVDNSQSEKGVDIQINGGRVVVRNLESESGADDARGKVTYQLQGQSADGQFKIYSNKKFQLILNGLNLMCPDGPAISIQQKKRCFITLASGTTTQLSDAETYATDALVAQGIACEDEKGCLFSEGQLIFGGSGSLLVTGLHQHGIASDEYVRIHPGLNIKVHAVKDGIHTKQQYHQSGSIVRSYAQKDALQSDSLGVQVNGGYLYLFGERALTVNGGGVVSVTDPGRLCSIDWVSGQ